MIQDKEYFSTYAIDRDFKFYISYDDKNAYVGIETNAEGWVSVGFGLPMMDKLIMFIGYLNKD